MELSNATLGSLPDGVDVPRYDRTALTPGIVHIGLGNFHRAHQAWYLHQLMQAGEAHDWAIIGAGVRPYDATMREKLLAQDCLTTLIQLDPGARHVEVTGAMIDYLPIEEGNAALIAQIADPAIRIVSLTVTEGGYYLDPATAAFDADHPDMQHDAGAPNAPLTAFGAIVAALKLRRASGVGPVTLQSCDNLQGNGAITRQTTVGLARMSDPDLADWIDANCSFPNAMVDCIVPATGPAEFERVQAMGINDAAPVTHERFRQWVIEDDFCAGRPPWDKAGATFTDDVHAFESMKIRMLNAGHQVLANAGELLSLPTIAACMADDSVSAFFRKVERDGIVPYVDAVPGMTPTAYLDLIATRFANPEIHDTTRRVAFDGSSRHTGFILPMVREARDADGDVTGLALTEALWARMCAGTREDGSVIEPNDPFWDDLNACAMQAKDCPRAWLEQEQVYGDLVSFGAFEAAFEASLTALWRDGVRATLESYIAQS